MKKIMYAEKAMDINQQDKSTYEKPAMVTYTEDSILDLIGPANTAGSPFFGDFHGNGHGPIPGHGHGGGHGRL